MWEIYVEKAINLTVPTLELFPSRKYYHSNAMT